MTDNVLEFPPLGVDEQVSTNLADLYVQPINLGYLWETGARSAPQGNTFVATLTFPLPGIPLQ